MTQTLSWQVLFYRVTLTTLSTPLLSCQFNQSVLLHYKRLISFNVLQWVLSGRHCICESFLSTQQLCQWPQFSGVIARIGYWIPPVILMSTGGGLWSQPSVSYPGLCLRRRPRGSFCITHTANALLGPPHFWTTFKSFSWLMTLTFWLDFFFFWTTKHFTLIGKSSYRVTPMEAASTQLEAETVLDHIPSWNCKETKMSNSFGLSSAFLLRCRKMRNSESASWYRFRERTNLNNF